MGFYSLRKLWNSEGKCARKACREPFYNGVETKLYYNSSTRLLYCESCATLINKYNPGLCIEVDVDESCE